MCQFVKCLFVSFFTECVSFPVVHFFYRDVYFLYIGKVVFHKDFMVGFIEQKLFQKSIETKNLF